MSIQPHTLHNMIHRESKNDSELCPVCNGSIGIDDVSAMEEKCNEIFARRKAMGIVDSMYSEKTTGIKTSESLFLRPLYQFGEKADLPSEIMLVPVGKWNTTKYGDVEIKMSDIEEMKQNFDDEVRKGVMIDVDHGTSMHGDAAAGWIKKVEVRKDGLYATEVEWTKLGKELVKEKIYKFLSPEFDLVHVVADNADKILHNVLMATSLVNRPLLKVIPALSFSEKENLTGSESKVMLFIDEVKEDSSTKNNMELKDILAKKKEERSAEEATFLTDHKDELTAEQKVAEGFETAPAPTPTPEVPPVDTAISAKEGDKTSVTMTASEVNKLKEDAEKGRVAFAEMEKNNVTKQFSSFVFSEEGGKFAPALVDPIVKFALGLTEAQRVEFSEIVKQLPDRKIFGEIGSDKTATANQTADALRAEVAKIAKDENITFSEALKKAQKADPKKFSEYRENLTKSDK